MAQDPNDPGEYDILYFSPGGMRSPSGDTLYVWPDSFPQDVTLHINAWNDNDVRGVSVILTDNCNAPPCSAELDPAKNNSNLYKCLEGGRVEHFYWQNCKVSQYPPVFYFGGDDATQETPMPPGNGLLATFLFTVHDTGRICLDTTWHPVGGELYFVTPSKQPYCPIFEKRTFVISECPYSCGDPNYDGITNIVDAVFLVNYIFRGGPPICVEKSGDVSCDDEVTVVDIVYLIGYLFKGGPEPGYCP
jgi:hypothetical protein